ncbi:hypothetical protein C427_0213 [Paraglaciecola psychrophila 170]|uniref:Uncharacterized protein n=1 Tax=Paraglaciecola psychrophila 170 TaxID=1129794 RepID=K7ARI0_9ALTE|nr:hypothetical protein C427_0213 [Paraglaciecola psychrophila 170]GAC37855.1 hypothetical protein GPSY_2234 [Paraglaciecola psychrophila 170]
MSGNGVNGKIIGPSAQAPPRLLRRNSASYEPRPESEQDKGE